MSSVPFRLLLKSENPFKPVDTGSIWNNPAFEKTDNLTQADSEDPFKKSSKRPKNFSISHDFNQLQTSSPGSDLNSLDDKKRIHRKNMDSFSSPRRYERLFQKVETKVLTKLDHSKIKIQGKESQSFKNYLDYLGQKSEKELEGFKKKMHLKCEPPSSDYFPQKGLSINIVDEFLPPEFKNGNISFEKTNPSIANMNETNFSKTPYIIRLNTKSSIASHDKTSSTPLKFLQNTPLKFLQSSSPLEKQYSFFGEGSDIIAARKLSEEVASNYRLYKSNATKNRDLQNKVTEFIRNQHVSNIFVSKSDKHIPLSTKIYKHIIETNDNSGTERISLTEVDPKLKKTFSFHPKPKVIQSRFNAYKRVNDKLQDANIEFKVQGLQHLELKLLQAHEDFTNRKALAVKHMSKINRQRLEKIQHQCNKTEKMLPVYTDLSSTKQDYDEFSLEEMPKAKKEIRVINKRLDRVLKSWKQSLINLSSPHLHH